MSGGGSVSEVEESIVLEIGGRVGVEESFLVVRCKRGDVFCVVDFIDWILFNLMWRFGFGVGLVWVGVFVFGVILE